MRSMGKEAADNRSIGIDAARGLLVLGVILGHFFEITQGKSFPAWIGAGVRMPLFIGLTGYLFNLERARSASVAALLRRSYPRLILPWIVACLVHVTLARELDVGTPLSLILWPPFHLWFVPIMLAFTIVAAVTRSTPAAMLAVAIPVSIAAMHLLGVGHMSPVPHDWLPDRRFFIYPIYFFFGVWIARTPPDPAGQRVAMILAPIGILWWCALYDSPGIAAEVAAELVACLPLLYLLPIVRTRRIPFPGLAAVGRNSLFYYLWHPLLFALWRVCGANGPMLLALSLATLAILLPPLRQYASVARILGIVRRPPALPTRPLQVATAGQAIS